MIKFKPKLGHITENRRNWHIREIEQLILYAKYYEEVIDSPGTSKKRRRLVKRRLRSVNKELSQRRAELARYDKQQI